MNYNIKSIPTTYRNIEFRSRLEARYAAFFDLINWPWTYEPFDLEGWSPDFLITGIDKSVLVEVKPLTDIDFDITEKIENAIKALGQRVDVLLTSVAPDNYRDNNICSIGWLGQYNDFSDQTTHILSWGRADVIRVDSNSILDHEGLAWNDNEISFVERISADLSHEFDSYHCSLSGYYAGGSTKGYAMNPKKLQELWNRAQIAVQYRHRIEAHKKAA